MCSVDLKREIISQDLLIVYARTNLYEFACCLFSVLQLSVWMPFQRLYVGQRSFFKISQHWKFKRRTRVLYAARIWSSEAFLGIPRISWASMIGQKRDAKTKSSHRYSGVISFQVSPFVVEHQKKPT